TQTATSTAATLTVNPKALTASIIGDPTRPYNGNTSATLTSANFSLTGLVGTDNFTVTQTSGTYNSKDVATANTVTASLSAGDFTPLGGTVASNYTLPTTASGAGHITKADATWTTDSNSKNYGDDDPTPLTIGSGSGFVETVTTTYSRTAGETVANSPYPITATLSPAGVLSNYNITNNGANFTIHPKAASVVANNMSKQYGDANPTFTATVTGTVNGDTLNYSLSTTATQFSNAGTYPITVTLC